MTDEWQEIGPAARARRDADRMSLKPCPFCGGMRGTKTVQCQVWPWRADDLQFLPRRDVAELGPNTPGE